MTKSHPAYRTQAADRYEQGRGDRLRLYLGISTATVCGLGVGCGSSNTSVPLSDAPGSNGGDSSIVGDDSGFGHLGDIGIGIGGNGEGGTTGTLTVAPVAPGTAVVDVTITDGVVTTTPVKFAATAHGVPVSNVVWSIDRGELGTIDPKTGAFTASGTAGGTGLITANAVGGSGSSTVSINLHVIQNGKPAGAVAGGAGGVGGVGGEGLGGKVPPALVTKLQAPSVAPDFKLLYPYDHTVWPRGLLAPLLQWPTAHPATAVLIHLSEKNFDFQGFYSGTALVHQPIDETAWTAAMTSNSGDLLHVEVTLLKAAGAVGPVKLDWTVAPGVLKGTVYYNSYSTALAKPVPGQADMRAAAILAIRPGATDPSLAIPGSGNKCIVCHTVSDDGSTLFAQDAIEPGDDYKNGASFDLTKGGAKIMDYKGAAPDTSTNNRKFLWSGLSKDGTYALQSSGNTQEAYGGPSAIFRRDNGNGVSSPGLDGVITEAVTPAFSRDGKKVAFNYWTGTAPGAGAGHSLFVMDFACGPGSFAAGAPTCKTFGFSGLRQVFNDPATDGYVGWPTWLPDSSAIVFHDVVTAPSNSSPLATWNNAEARLALVTVPATGAPASVYLNQADGVSADGKASYLPVNAMHPHDSVLNYEPTVNPIASGGFFWVVFTSRRMYGNVADKDPYDNGDGTYPIPKKLWVAAIDQSGAPGKDPSHPAFYLPGQELFAGNMRGYWVVDPCKMDGATCETGDQCCNGYCRQAAPGQPLMCGGKPKGPSCAQEFEACTTSADCCNVAIGFQCLNGHCARPPIK